jgi:TatD DNase family protein
MLLDSHCHLQLFPIEKQRQLLKDMATQDIGAVIIGTHPEDCDSAVNLAKENNNVWCALGFHPTEAEKIPDFSKAIEKIENWLKDQTVSSKIVAIGEIGLDYFGLPLQSVKDRQEQLFRLQIKLAQKYHKPIIVHSRESYDEIYRILQEENVSRVVMHFFNGSAKRAQQFLELGAYISFSPIITFTEDYNKAVLSVPLEKLLLETDSPFVRENTPLDIIKVYDKVSLVKGASRSELEKTFFDNAQTLFNLN